MPAPIDRPRTRGPRTRQERALQWGLQQITPAERQFFIAVVALLAADGPARLRALCAAVRRVVPRED